MSNPAWMAREQLRRTTKRAADAAAALLAAEKAAAKKRRVELRGGGGGAVAVGGAEAGGGAAVRFAKQPVPTDFVPAACPCTCKNKNRYAHFRSDVHEAWMASNLANADDSHVEEVEEVEAPAPQSEQERLAAAMRAEEINGGPVESAARPVESESEDEGGDDSDGAVSKGSRSHGSNSAGSSSSSGFSRLSNASQISAAALHSNTSTPRQSPRRVQFVPRVNR